jgi:hypothetical protein
MKKWGQVFSKTSGLPFLGKQAAEIGIPTTSKTKRLQFFYR